MAASPPTSHPKPFGWSDIAPALATTIVAVAVGLYTEDWRLPQYITEVTLDAFTLGSPAEPARSLAILDIDDESYEKDFGRRSPLDSAKVTLLIELALEGGATVVGVDIDTTSPHCHDPRVICASAVPGNGYAGIAPWRFSKDTHERGIRNETGIVRTHPPFPSKSFSDAIFDRYRQAGSGHGDAPQEHHPGSYIRFVSRRPCRETPCINHPLFPVFPAHPLLQDPNAPAGFRIQRPFQDKIVLMGGTAEALRDRHETPFGPEAGLEIHAEMISSRFSPPLEPLETCESVGLDLLFSAVVFVTATFVGAAVGRRFAELAKFAIPWAFLLAIGFLSYKSFPVSQLFYSFLLIGLGLAIESLFHPLTHALFAHPHHPHDKESPHDPVTPRATVFPVSFVPCRREPGTRPQRPSGRRPG